MRSIGIPMILAALLVGAPGAFAETKGAATVEWLVADADVVVRGRIVKAEAVGTASYPWARVEMEVAETFKGDALSGRVYYEPGDSVWVNKWMAERAEVVAFLKRGRRVEGQGTPVPFRDDLVKYDRGCAFALVDGCELFTCDFDVIRTRAGALAALREAAAYPAPVRISAWMEPPHNSKAWRRLGGYANWCVVQMPADGRWARQMDWRTGARLWEPFHRAVVPAEAATAENVAIFREMLRSPAVYPALAAEWPTRLDRLAMRYYPDRETGRRMLAGWGIDPGPVVTEAPALPYAPVRWGAWGLRAGALLLGLGMLARWTGRAGPRAGMVAWVSLALCVAAGVAWARGGGAYDSLVFPAGGHDHRVEVREGWVVFLRVASAPQAYPALHARTTHSMERSPLLKAQSCWGGGGVWLDRGVVPGRGAGGAPMPYVLAWVRLAWVAGLFGALPAWRAGAWGFGSARGWWRRRAGRCRACGYDLRASAGRCPECGAA